MIIQLHDGQNRIVGKVKKTILHAFAFHLFLVLHERLDARQLLGHVPIGVYHAALVEEVCKAVAVVVVLGLVCGKHVESYRLKLLLAENAAYVFLSTEMFLVVRLYSRSN